MYGYSWLHSGAAEFRIGGYEDFCLSHYFFLFFSFNFSPLELVVGHLFSYSSTHNLPHFLWNALREREGSLLFLSFIQPNPFPLQYCLACWLSFIRSHLASEPAEFGVYYQLVTINCWCTVGSFIFNPFGCGAALFSFTIPPPSGIPLVRLSKISFQLTEQASSFSSSSSSPSTEKKGDKPLSLSVYFVPFIPFFPLFISTTRALSISLRSSLFDCLSTYCTADCQGSGVPCTEPPFLFSPQTLKNTPPPSCKIRWISKS